ADADGARQIYRQIAGSAAESYYQMLSLRALARLGEPPAETKSNNAAPAPESDPPLSPDANFHLARARLLAALALRPLAVAELDEIQRQSGGALRGFLMREYFQAGAYSRSLQLANQLPSTRAERDLYRYPLAFWDLIRQKARDRDLDPYLVLGLRQLIPPTANRIARQLGFPAPSQDSLFEPEVNVTLGTQYLKDLLQRYADNWYKAIAAYNAGEAAVDRWEKEIATDDIEEFVERIPYVETRGYVKLVLRNHQIYKRLYDTQK